MADGTKVHFRVLEGAGGVVSLGFLNAAGVTIVVVKMSGRN